MKVLVVSQYFWPETFRVNDIVEYLVSKKYEVDVLTGYPTYPSKDNFKDFKNQKKENYYGANIYRVPIFDRKKGNTFDLFLNYSSFVFSSIVIGYFLLRKKKYDVIFSFATSPITSSIPGIFFSYIFKIKSVIWILDFWPDILKELKIINNKYLFYLLDRIVEYIYSKYSCILVQSRSFQKILADKKGVTSYYFPSWAENLSKDRLIDNYLVSKYKNDNSLKIVFTGNVGEAQNLDCILKISRDLENYNIKWIVVGSGRGLLNLSQKIKDYGIKNFILEGSKPLNEIKNYHEIADILLISLKSGLALSSTIPGKLQTYLSMNKYVLGLVSGEASKIIKESNVGSAFSEDELEKLKEKIIFLEKNRNELQLKIPNSGYDYLIKNFNQEDRMIYLERIFNNIKLSYPTIKLIKNASKINYNINFIIVGLNLAYLGYYGLGKIEINKDTFHWPDGIFKNRFFDKKIPKSAGRNFFSNLVFSNSLKNIYILGELSEKTLLYLKNKFIGKNLIHIDLPYDTYDKIFKKIEHMRYSKNDIVILTLPTPKQEQVANLIAKSNEYYKIFCLGGALAMLSGTEKPVPFYLDRLGLEFMWRIKNDPYRRTTRLLTTFISYILNELRGKYRSLKTETYFE